jgi:hypothetical protein
VEHGRSVPRVKSGGVDGAVVRGCGQRAGSVREERDHVHRGPGQRRVEVVSVENPDVRAADTRRRQLGIAPGVLPAMGGGHEGAGLRGPGEYDVAWLVAHEECAHDVCPLGIPDVNHADAVREMIDHPYLAFAPFGEGHRFEANRNRRDLLQVAPLDVKDLDAIVRRIRRVEETSVR